MTYLRCTLLLCVLSVNSYGQNYNETIEVNGDFNYSNNSSNRLEAMRRKLEKRNELMVKKQIENIRYQNELKLMRETEKKMNEMLKQI